MGAATYRIPWGVAQLRRPDAAEPDTCSPDDLAAWHPGNPARGRCDITALLVNDLLGGDLMLGDVHVGGEPRGHHWWNCLVTGVELDLTREQFRSNETITQGRLVKRPPGPLPRRWEEYLLLRRRVADWLGPLPSSDPTDSTTGGPGA